MWVEEAGQRGLQQVAKGTSSRWEQQEAGVSILPALPRCWCTRRQRTYHTVEVLTHTNPALGPHPTPQYFASVTALLVYAAPIYFQDPATRGTQGELTRDYIRSMRLLQNTSRWLHGGVG